MAEFNRAFDNMMRQRAKSQAASQRQAELESRSKPVYQFKGYDGDQPILQAPGGDPFTAGELTTNGFQESGTTADQHNAGQLLRTGGMPYYAPEKPERPTENKVVKFGYMFRHEQWDRTRLFCKFPGNNPPIQVANTQYFSYGCNFVSLIDESTIISQDWYQELEVGTGVLSPDPYPNQTYWNHFYKRYIGYKYDKIKPDGATNLFSDTRDVDTPPGSSNYTVDPEPLTLPAGMAYQDHFSHDYFASGTLGGIGGMSFGGALLLPPTYQAFTSYTTTAQYVFLSTVSTALAYSLEYDQYPDTQINIANGRISLPSGKLYELRVTDDAVKASFIKRYAPVVKLSDLGIPEDLYSYINATTLRAENEGGYDAITYVSQCFLDRFSGASIVCPLPFNFKLMSAWYIKIDLVNTPRQDDNTFGSFSYIDIYPCFGVF